MANKKKKKKKKERKRESKGQAYSGVEELKMQSEKIYKTSLIFKRKPKTARRKTTQNSKGGRGK